MYRGLDKARVETMKMTLDDWLSAAADQVNCPYTTLLIAADWFEEDRQPEVAFLLRDYARGEKMLKGPFVVGKCFLICTATLYYVGRVTKNEIGFLEMEQASWVHRTGRLSQLIKMKSFAAEHHLNNPPRLEVCGEVGINTQSIVSWYPWKGDLPKESQ